MWICERCEAYNVDEQCKCRLCGAEKPEIYPAEEKTEQGSSVTADQAVSAVECEEDTANDNNTDRSGLTVMIVETETGKSMKMTYPDDSGKYDDLPDPYERIASNAIEDRKQKILRIIKTVLLIAAFVGLLTGSVLFLKSYANNNKAKRTNKSAEMIDYCNSLNDNLSMIQHGEG